MAIVGQDKLLKKIESFNLTTLPHTIALIGEKGSGKTLLCEFISKQFDLPFVDWKGMNKEQAKTLIDVSSVPIPYLYRIDALDLAERGNQKAQVLLKLLEEPPSNLFIIITAENRSQMIPTIVNRCQVWELAKYSKETLKQFVTDERILEVAKTPGQCLSLSLSNYDVMVEYVNRMYDKIHLACIPNALVIANKIAYKDKDEGFDFDLFVDISLKIISQKIVENPDPIYIQYYKLTNQLANDRFIFNIDKRKLMEQFLIQMRELTR